MIEEFKNWLVGLPFIAFIFIFTFLAMKYPVIVGITAWFVIISFGSWLIGALIRTARNN